MNKITFLFFLFLCSQAVNKIHAQVAAKEATLPEVYDYTYSDTLVKGGSNFDLVTRIYLPKGAGPWPVVITRTPYHNGITKGDNIPEGQEFARKGIGYILQYCRGKGGSGGCYEPNIYEREDGLALVHWTARQTWCKNIGLFGTSYTALTAWIIADSLPEKVKGMHVHHYGINRYLSAYKDGLFRQDILTGWAIDNASEIKERPLREADEPYYKEYRYMPQKEMDVDLFGVELPWYREWISCTDYDHPYWHKGVWGTLKEIPSSIQIPVTIVAGLFDHHLEGTLAAYEQLNPSIKPKSRLIIGPWDHYYEITPTVHQPQNARAVDVFVDQFNWLRNVVVEEKIPDGNVAVYFIGADKWVTFDTWPIKPEKKVIYYLSQSINKEQIKVYDLVRKNKNRSFTFRFEYDPQDPVMSVGGETVFNSRKRSGSRLQPEAGYRDDVIAFLSEPLSTPLTIAGAIKAEMCVSSDCDDTCITYKVSEVFPDGSAYNIRSGITTLAYRNDRFGSRRLYIPGDIVSLEIETLPVTWQIKKGNRLRVDITSSNFPEYSIHSNYAGVWSEQNKTRKAVQTIYAGKDHPAKIIIPVIEME